MLYRIYASRDTTITNKYVLGRRATGSNGGASEVLQLFKLSGSLQSGTAANILISFPTASALVAYSASHTGSSPVWHLVMRNVETSNPNIGSFDVSIYPVERDWDEGSGHDLDYWTDRGFANWQYAKNGIQWDALGAVPVSSTFSATFHFATGHEDLDTDITSLALASQYGLWIGLSQSLMDDTNEYYLKAFRSRQTHFQEHAPVIEVRWNDFTGSLSYVSGMVVDSTGNLIGNIYNLRSVYDRSETPTLKTHFRPQDWNLAVVSTGTLTTSGTVLTNAYWSIIDDVTDEVIVPFGTGSPAYTRMSYDGLGNYFKFHMQNLVPGFVYRFDIGYYDSAGDWRVIHGEDMKFRVR